MPHDSDVQRTSHAHHDALLVAALAADDLAGTDRDHATALIETCTDCMALHDDLVAIARATAVVPPPIATRTRDFRLTPEQAGRLRPSGWRRALGAFASPRLAFARPLGIGLTTIGLAGLLITNIPLGFGSASSAGAPEAVSLPASREGSSDVTGEAGGSGDGAVTLGPLQQPAASGGYGAAASAAAAAAPAATAAPVPAASTAPHSVRDQNLGSAGPEPAGSSRLTAGEPKAQPSAPQDANVDVTTESVPPTDIRTVVLVAVVLVGLGLLVLRRVARRMTPR